jgi:hypothetical protein
VLDDRAVAMTDVEEMNPKQQLPPKVDSSIQP